MASYQGPVPPPATKDDDRKDAKGCAFTSVPFFAGALIALLAGSPVAVGIMLGIGALVLGISVLVAFEEAENAKAKQVKLPDGRTVSLNEHARVIYHRRYVVPATDFDEEDQQVWARTIAATNKIARSEVVRQRLIDSVQVSAVLPEWLWSIAERLARHSEVRARQQQVFRKVAPDDPDIAAIAAPQRRVQELLAKDVAERVRSLEAFADRLGKADDWTRKLASVQELAGLNSLHIDILALLGRHDMDDDLSKRLANDSQAVIEQARDAIREANEAAANLLPVPAEDDDMPER